MSLDVSDSVERAHNALNSGEEHAACITEGCGENMDSRHVKRTRDLSKLFYRDASEAAELSEIMKEPETTLSVKDLLLREEVNEEGLDLSLGTAQETFILLEYWDARKALVDKFGEDAMDQPTPEMSQYSPSFYDVLCKAHDYYEKMYYLTKNLSEYEKRCVRFYWTVTVNAELVEAGCRPIYPKGTLSALDIYETVESYFRIMRKHGQPVFEKPYFFLSRKEKLALDWKIYNVKQSRQYDDSEIHISLLAALT